MKIQLISKPTLVWPQEAHEARQDQLDGSVSANLLEFAGRTCYDSLGSGRNSADYHKHLLDVGHGSVLEHAQYSFLVSGVSRGLTHELVRHRVGVAISQRSTRYVDESLSEVVTHPLLKQAMGAMSGGDYAELVEQMKYCDSENRRLYMKVNCVVYDDLVNRGVDKPTARKQARGAARQYLENGLETELVWSANIRTLRHVINMRGSEHADAEIREFAVGLYNIMHAECPEYFSDGIIGTAKDGTATVTIKPI